MWQTKYASAVPKNLGVGVNFRPFSECYFLSGRPQSVTHTFDSEVFLHSWLLWLTVCCPWGLDFGRSVNTISTRKTDYAHLFTTGFSDLPTVLNLAQVPPNLHSFTKSGSVLLVSLRCFVQGQLQEWTEHCLTAVLKI